MNNSISCAPMRFAFIIFSVLFTVGLSAQQYNFEVFNAEQGLAQSGVYDIIQDKNGYLYVGTEGGGVSRFDGVNFQNFDSDEGLSGVKVRKILERHNGDLWFATETGGITIYSVSGEIHYLDTTNILPVNHVRALAEDSLGVVWVGTNGGGAVRIENNQPTYFNTLNGLKSNTVRDIIVSKSDRIHLCTDSGLVVMEQGQLIASFHGADQFKSAFLNGYEDDEGWLWFGTESGLCLFRNDSLIRLNIQGETASRFKAICQDAFGDYWLGTRDGLIKIKKADVDSDPIPSTKITVEQGLSNNRIRTIFRDRSNALWFGTFFGGICKLSEVAFQHYGEGAEIPDVNITSIMLDSDNDIWLGSMSGFIYHFHDQTRKIKYYNTKLEDNTIQSIIQTHDLKVMFGTNKDGVHLVEDNTTRKIIRHSKVGVVRQILEVSPERIVIAASEGLFEWSNQTLIKLHDAPFTCLEVRDSIMYGGAELGTYHAALSRLDTLSIIEGSERIPVTSLATNSKGNVWIGTDGMGVYSLRKGKLKQYKSKKYLSSYNISFLKVDLDENLWIGTQKGIDKIELDYEMGMILDIKHFGAKDGFRSVETNRNAAALTAQGWIMFGTYHGVTLFAEELIFPNPNPPLIKITNIQLFHENVDWSIYKCEDDTLNASLPYNQNYFTFHFEAIDLNSPQKVVYQYRLQGYDLGWSNMSDIKEVTYSQIPPGRYMFQVRSRNGQGFWNIHPAEFSFTINPPLYMRPWFIILMVVVLGGAVFGIYSWRVRILVKENLVLESKVTERTYSLEQEKIKSENLLLNILPAETAHELKEKGSADTREYEWASVLFSDFVGFTNLSEKLSSDQIIEHLDRYFEAFDNETERYKVEKIKTIGDAYMCATGVPNEDENHAEHLIEFAFKMVEAMEKFNVQNEKDGEPPWNLRIGIHSGPVITGVVGKKKFTYDIWGDTVNIAARMESAGEPGKVNISAATSALVKDKYAFIERGKLDAKNKGKMDMFFVYPKTKQ